MRAWRLAVATIIVCMFAAAAAAQEMPFKLVRDMILVPVEVNGVKTMGRLDTGGNVSIMHPAFAEKLGLRVGDKMIATGIAKTRVYDTIQPVDVKLGDQALRTNRILLVALNSMAPDAEYGIGITLGEDVFGDQIVEIDFDRSVIEFTPVAKFNDFPKSAPIKLRQERGGNRRFTGSITGRKSISIGFDTGNPGTASFSQYVARTALKGQPTSEFVADGVDGSIPLKRSTLPALTLAGTTVVNVPVSYGPGADESVGIGMQILKRFNLVLDLSHDRIWMTPNSNVSAPFRKDRIGLDTNSNTWPKPILLVASGSPAQRAGFKAGEVIARATDAAGQLVDNFDELEEDQRLILEMMDGSRRELVAKSYF